MNTFREKIKRGQSKFAPKFIEPLTASSQEGGLKVKGDPQHFLEVLKSGVLGSVVDTCRAVSQHPNTSTKARERHAL